MAELPLTRAGATVETLHGESIADPYRWLEDTRSPETQLWVSAQNAVTHQVLDALDGREQIRDRVTELLDVVREGAPHRHGDRYFFTRKQGLADQAVLVVADAPGEKGEVLLDPNEMSEDGTVSLTGWSVDRAGRLLAYGLSEAGSDWTIWRVRDVESGKDLDDVVEWAKFSTAAWLPEGDGFFYGAYDEPSDGDVWLETQRSQRVQLHRIGTPQSQDTVVYVDDDPQATPWSYVTDDGHWLVLHITRGTEVKSVVRVLDLTDPDAQLQALVPEPVADTRVIGNDGSTFYLLTTLDTSRRRVVAADLDHPQAEHWRVVVPEGEEMIVDAVQTGGRIACHLLHDASSRLSLTAVLDATDAADAGAGPSVELPGLLSIEEIAADRDDTVLHLATASFDDPGSVLGVDITTGEVTVVQQASLSQPLADLVIERVRATSEDGTEVPMFIVHRRDVTPNGDVRALLYGYGGFDISITPGFSAAQATWVERGGLLAIANLRGGGEFGTEWYEAGKLANKQHVFDDFAGCARWLASSGWSRPGRIAINGASNGGLLVGAVLTQHPELIGAAVPEVGVLDMLRFHKFTIGWAWTSDFGDPDDPEQFRWAHAYSPLHNVQPNASYPPTLVMTGDHDDRVVPGHSFKFGSTLQAAQGGDAPILIRIETSAGHGAGKPTSKVIDERADMLGFCEAALDGRLPSWTSLRGW